MANLDIGILAANIEGWHEARNLIKGSTDQAQFVKLIEEAGELAANIARGKDIRDDIGDMVVILINIARRNEYTLADCMQVAWDDIKHRKGKMVNGVFIKEDDMPMGAQGTRPENKETITLGFASRIGATHRVGETFYHKHSDHKFWSVWVDNTWKIMSGEPIGELNEL